MELIAHFLERVLNSFFVRDDAFLFDIMPTEQPGHDANRGQGLKKKKLS